MRFSTIAAAALAATPSVVSAAGTLGYAIGNRKADGSCKFTSDYEADFDTLKSTATVVRTYSASTCNTAQQILPAAASKGFKVMLGVWPDTDEALNADIEALQSAFKSSGTDAVSAITVGSEALYRGNLNGDQLWAKIQRVQNLFPNIKIGTADSWDKYTDGSADPLIKGGVKLLLVNAFPYWQGDDITKATATYLDDIQQAFGHIQRLGGGGIELANGETGWPSDGGSNYGAAVAGTANAETFYKQAVCGMLKWDVDVYYFEAFDEPWKPLSEGKSGDKSDETHWGAFTADRTGKFDLSC